MTEKRYVQLDDGLDFIIKDIVTGKLYSDNGSMLQLVNEQHEQIQLLQVDKSDLSIDIEVQNEKINRLEEENEQLNDENEQLKQENKALKERKEFLELLTTHRGEMVSMANSIIQDLPNTPTVKAQEMWYEFKEEMYQEWKEQKGEVE